MTPYSNRTCYSIRIGNEEEVYFVIWEGGMIIGQPEVVGEEK